MAPAPGVVVGELPEHLELLGAHPAPRGLDAHHLVGAALALAVDAVVQAEDTEHVLIEVAGDVALELQLELVDVPCLFGIDLDDRHVHSSEIRPDWSGLTACQT